MTGEAHNALLDAWEEIDQVAGRLGYKHRLYPRLDRAVKHIKLALDAEDMPWVRVRAPALSRNQTPEGGS